MPQNKIHGNVITYQKTAYILDITSMYTVYKENKSDMENTMKKGYMIPNIVSQIHLQLDIFNVAAIEI